MHGRRAKPGAGGAGHTSVRGGAAPGAAAHEPSVFDSRCAAQRLLGVIASKWSILILHRLHGGAVRFNALQRDLGTKGRGGGGAGANGAGGISQKVLAQQLRRLERWGLVKRKVHPTVPPSVEYSLTPAARELSATLEALCGWAERHIGTQGTGADGDGRAKR